MQKRFYDKGYQDGCIKDEKKKDYRIACDKCGWLVTITNKYGRELCPACGKMVYLDKKQEFMQRMKSEMRK
jgi:predicted RNA-binding Zn-ribbon protein involved in translation (DUF1610 family)